MGEGEGAGEGEGEGGVALPVSAQVFGEPTEFAPAALQASLQIFLGVSVSMPVVTCGQGYTRAETLRPCSPCPSGYFKGELDDAACTACPYRGTRSDLASSSEENCTCAKGHSLSNVKLQNPSDEVSLVCRRDGQISPEQAAEVAASISSAVAAVIAANVALTVSYFHDDDCLLVLI